jgi:hypothetical protein
VIVYFGQVFLKITEVAQIFNYSKLSKPQAWPRAQVYYISDKACKKPKLAV